MKSAGLTETVTVRLTKPERDRLEARAAKEKRRISDYVRLLIEKALENGK